MSSLADILGEGFECHSAALIAGGSLSGERSRSMLRVVRRRRRIRAASATGGSVLAVSAVAVGAMALNPLVNAQPASTPFITNGLYPWCDVSTYPAVNPDALGASRYEGRLYEDYPDLDFVYVAPNATHSKVVPDANGAYYLTTPGGIEWMTIPSQESTDYMVGVPGATGGIVTDIFIGGVGGFLDPVGPEGPRLGYEWTTVVPEAIPAGIDVQALSEVLVETLGYQARMPDVSMVPDGAIVETVFRWHDGRQLAVEIHKDEPGPEVPDYTDLASVSVRVSNLPNGEVFEITSTYDPSMTWEVACWPYRDAASPTATSTIGSEPTPSRGATASPSPGISQGGFDAGPTPSPSYVTPAPSPSPSVARPSASPSPTT